MYQECKFNRDCDISETVPSLAVDLGEVIRTGVVCDSSFVPSFNEIEEPSKVGSRIRNVFDSLDSQKSISSIVNNSQPSHEDGENS